MRTFRFFILILAIAISCPAFGQGLKAFKLKNGLSVLIWEDASQPDVFGMVGVRAGSVNDPEQYTGLAHYLEHLMFKGTDKIGALDWEKEEPLYKQIIEKYDEMAETTDPAQRNAINKEINQLSIEAGRIAVSNEFSNLLESIGGKDDNAGTIYDYTTYFSAFPAYQINKWLELFSQRLLNPVFRNFQAELETVYEEYNRMMDNPSRTLSNFIFEKAFEGHPYSRPVLGLPEHLKNPRISQLIKFYDDWYTAENMVLILVGNVDAQKISGRIASTFGRIPQKATPERKVYSDLEIKGRKQYSGKVGSYPTVTLIYNGVTSNHPDENALLIAMRLLSNSNGTGVLDKLTTDGELLMGVASPIFLREEGRCIIQAIPLYDENQRRFESLKTAERKLLQAIEKISKGEFDDWIVEAIKLNMCRQYDLNIESNEDRANLLFDAFVNEKDLGSVINYQDEIMAVSIEDIKRVAKKYLSNDFITLNTEKSTGGKTSKIEKPGFDPIELPEGQQSLYAMQFKGMPIETVEEKFLDFSDVQIRKINDRSKLFYVNNPENELFTLTLKYGAGTNDFPKLGIAASLMNNAGIMGVFEPQELKQELSRLNVSSYVTASDDYLRISMNGYEVSLVEACQLLSRQILMPKLDEKQLSNIKGSILGNRQQRKTNIQMLGGALNEFIKYQDKSDYIDELTDKEVMELQLSELTGDINRAANYETEIHYTGSLPLDDVYEILSNNLPLVANEKPTLSPRVKPFAEVTENTVYFLPNSNAEQAQIYLFAPTTNYDKKDDVLHEAFYQYFSGSFNGLVISELREKHSMVYTAGGIIASPILPGYPTFFRGFIGTQNDKAIEALTLYMGLVRNMPEIPERMDNIKSYLRQIILTSKPNVRNKSAFIEEYRRKGYSQDPAIEMLPIIDALTFDDIVKFYKENLKDKPIVIGIMGDPKIINADELKKFGKVVRVNEKRLFNSKDAMF